MAKYWVKLYTEILNDSKMAVFPDRLWRRTVEIFLAAGHYDNDGDLPDTDQLAWLLRINTAELENDLQEIAQTGILTRTDAGWCVTKFAQRQASVPGKDRVKQYRQRQKQQQYYGDVTDLKRDVTQRQNQNQNQSHSTTTNFDDDPESDISNLRKLQTAFINASGIGAYNTEDVEVFQELDEQGVTPDDMTAAVRTLQAKKYTIKGPQSIVTTAINIAKQRTAIPTDSRNIPSEVY